MRFTSRSTLFGLACAAGALVPALAAAQNPSDAAAPCHELLCALVFDWGSGKTSATYGADRKYGSGDDFEAKFRSALAGHGIRTKDAPASGPLTITLRPTMRSKVMCDAMAGVSTDKSCTAMTDLAVNFTSSDPAAKAPGALRISNRCGSPDTFMKMSEFGQYAADMLYYSLEGETKKEQRPVSRCY